MMPKSSSPAMPAFDAVIAAPFGGLGVRVESGALTELVYLPASFRPQAPKNALARRVVGQISGYLADPNFVFDLPLAVRGSVFQQRVWRAIAGIPAGSTRTYGALAKLVRSAPRAVGQACGANWFPLVIPCHRVLAAGGIGGFGGGETDGFHLAVKRWLLRHEGVAGYA